MHLLFHLASKSDSLHLSYHSWFTRHCFSHQVLKLKKKKNVCAPFRLKCLLLRCQKSVTLCSLGDMYGFSMCSTWKTPISELGSDIFHHRTFSSPVSLWFRKMCHIILQIITAKYWRQSCQAVVFVLLLELYLGWISNEDWHGWFLFEKVIVIPKSILNIFILLCLYYTAVIFLGEYTRRTKINVPVYWQQFLTYIALGEKKMILCVIVFTDA